MGEDIGLWLALISLALGGVNSFFLYKNWKVLYLGEVKKRPIIRIRKERHPGGSLPKEKGLCGLQVIIKNLGHFSTSLVKIRALIKRNDKSSFSPFLKLFPTLPIEILPLKEYKTNIYFRISDRLKKEIQKDLPIKVNLTFEFTHTKIEGNLLIGKKGIFWDAEEIKKNKRIKREYYYPKIPEELKNMLKNKTPI